MAKKILFQGRTYEFPDDATEAQIQQELRSRTNGNARPGKRRLTIYALSAAVVGLLVLVAVSSKKPRQAGNTSKQVPTTAIAKPHAQVHPDAVPEPLRPAATGFVIESNLDRAGILAGWAESSRAAG